MSEHIVIAEDDEDLAFVLREALRRQHYEAEVAPTAGALLDKLKATPYDLILLDVRLPDMDGLDAIPKCRELAPDTPIIVMTAHGTRQTAMDAMTRGAYDFFTKPLKMDEFQVVVSRALDRRRLQKQIKVLRESQPSGVEGLIGQSEALKRVVEMAHRAAPTDLTVLIRGESGTGKEVLARGIHRLSPRKDGPFVPVNCAAIPEGLLESELFGHERGAFTGAVRARPGRFELAQGGHALPGRDRRHAAGHAGQDPARAPGARVRAGRGHAHDRGRRAGDRGHPPRPRGGGGAGDVPPGSVLPPPGRGHVPAVAARARGRPAAPGHPPAGARGQAAQPHARHPLARGPALPVDLRVAGQRARDAARARGRDGDERRRHHPRAPPARDPARGPGPARRGGERAGADRLARRGARGVGAAHDPRRALADPGVQARAAKALGVSERSLWYRIKKLGIQVRTPEDGPPAG